MRKLMLGGAALAALAVSPALAADLPVRPIYKAPPPVVYGWTGFYGGVNVGYSWGRQSNTFTTTVLGVGTLVATETQNVDGVIGGVQWGYNWQLGNYVLGTESDIQASGQSGSTFYCFNAACTNSTLAEHRLRWFGTARTRLGVLPMQQVLLYVTGGLAYGQVRSDYTSTLGGVALGTLSFRDTRAGWTVGGGIEAALGGGWSAKVEYLYIDLGKNTVTQVSAAGVTQFQIDSRFTDHIARVGLNYKIGG